MISIAELEARSRYLEDEIEMLKKQIKPDGLDERLVARKGQNGSYRYYARKRGKEGKYEERYLGADDGNMARKMAFYEYRDARIKDALEEKNAINKMLAYYRKDSKLNEFQKAHPGHMNLIHDWIKTQAVDSLSKEEKEIFDAVERWKNAKYERSSLHPENLNVPTIVPGLFVRSKSESMMVSEFEKYHVAYRYEEVLRLVDSNGKIILLSPDFSCQNMRTREIIRIEHLGKCDDEEYMENFWWREEIYRQNGIYLEKNLIVTTETKDSPLDINWVDEIIKYRLI